MHDLTETHLSKTLLPLGERFGPAELGRFTSALFGRFGISERLGSAEPGLLGPDELGLLGPTELGCLEHEELGRLVALHSRVIIEDSLDRSFILDLL